MAVHKLSFEDFEEIKYQLVAIHTSLEDYRLAYFINQKLNLNLSKSKNEIHIKIKQGESKLARFSYYDKEKQITWDLIQNKNEVKQQRKDSKQNLFSDMLIEVSTKVFLLPEYKKVDYFLKFEDVVGSINIKEIQLLLNTIDTITTAYSLETNKIKSKNNLIF